MSRRGFDRGDTGKLGSRPASIWCKAAWFSRNDDCRTNPGRAISAAARIARSSRTRALGQDLNIRHDEAAAHALSVHDVVTMITTADLQYVSAHVVRLGKTMISTVARGTSYGVLDKLTSLATPAVAKSLQ